MWIQQAVRKSDAMLAFTAGGFEDVLLQFHRVLVTPHQECCILSAVHTNART